jgi:hypothetical protein
MSEETREDVAGRLGVPADLLGDDPTGWETRAQNLLDWRGPVAPAVPYAPPAAGQGKVGDPRATTSQLSEGQLASMSPGQINEARRAGRLNNLLRGY